LAGLHFGRLLKNSSGHPVKKEKLVKALVEPAPRKLEDKDVEAKAVLDPAPNCPIVH
jgi:hypothetical protein